VSSNARNGDLLTTIHDDDDDDNDDDGNDGDPTIQ
jgi:hypothetical protein